MTAERDKCGLSSILPMSCRGRAEAFAQRLQSRLSSLGSPDAESSWLAHENPIAVSQPRHSSEAEVFIDLDRLDSPGSPEEELEEELNQLLNRDGLKHSQECHCVPGQKSADSDSDQTYYDSEDAINGFCSGPEPEKENYVSSISITKDLTVECPKILENSVDIEDVEEEERIPRVRRCSSLKTGKTPPGTPGSKKIVRFADVLGLDLADVRVFLDEIPKIPPSAYNDLKDLDCEPVQKLEKVLVPLFQQPGGLVNFLDLVRDHQVRLENALVEDVVNLTVSGTVRVKNLDFHKSVHVRYSLNAWKSYSEVQASYVENSCDGFSDKFSFVIYAGSLGIGQRLEFAVKFSCKGIQYWDNNSGLNYCFQCLPSSSNTYVAPITAGADVDTWGASFY